MAKKKTKKKTAKKKTGKRKPTAAPENKMLNAPETKDGCGPISETENPCSNDTDQDEGYF